MTIDQTQSHAQAVREQRAGGLTGFGVLALPTGPRLVQYAEVDGRALVEGDILLGSVAEARQGALIHALNTLALALPEDIQALEALHELPKVITSIRDVLEKASGQERGALRAIGIKGDRFRWPGGVIPYEIDDNLPAQERVTGAIKHWESLTPIRFVERTNQKDWVVFTPGLGCASFIGRIGGRQTIELAEECSMGNAVHEIGHTVGLFHEQSRADRDKFVEIRWNNILASARSNFNQFINNSDDIGVYDFGSIMHYPPTAFAQNSSEPTIVARTPGVVFGQRERLSQGDIAGVRRLYPNL